MFSGDHHVAARRSEMFMLYKTENEVTSVTARVLVYLARDPHHIGGAGMAVRTREVVTRTEIAHLYEGALSHLYPQLLSGPTCWEFSMRFHLQR